jgi:LysM repeat protein
MMAMPAPEQANGRFEDLLPLDDFAPSLLGIYRKMMEIEAVIQGYSDLYGVDYELARATCMYESGGNANLTSWAGAKGYFQVMPATFRSLRVETNIEAGIKYIGQLVDRFDREDYALAAYNGGPTTVGRSRPMRLESLQYVLGVGYYRTMLKLHERSIRHHATTLGLTTVGEGEDWWSLSERLGLTLLQLRLHNPYLASRTLREGQLIAYPPAPRDNLYRVDGAFLEYRSRLGDNYFNIAFTLDVDLDELRTENSLWHLQTLSAGTRLRIPLSWEHKHQLYEVKANQTLAEIAEDLGSSPWRLVRDNGIWNQTVTAGKLLRVRTVPAQPTYVVHRVTRGENLTSISRRYGSTIEAIQGANNMVGRTVIRIGQELRIPSLGK